MTPSGRPGDFDLVATLGPASDSAATIAALAKAGANLFRINLTHARSDWLAAVLERLAGQADPAAGPLPVVADLPGCKPRTGDLDGPVRLRLGEHVWLGRTAPAGTNACRIPLDFAEINCRPRAGDKLLLRDGRIRLVVVRAAAGGCLCTVAAGGEVVDRMGVALAGEAGARMRRALPQDLLEHCLRGGVRSFLLSYCEEAADLAEVAEACRAHGVEGVRLIPKVETLRALDNLPEILGGCETICVARGDLGTQVPLPALPGVERRLLAAARAAGRRAWVAGEVLAGCSRAGGASRGELAGVWAALDHGAAGFILSDETAVGPDPAAAVQLLRDLIRSWSGQAAI
jgi:pyruvate kinase